MVPQAALNAWAQHAPWPNDLGYVWFSGHAKVLTFPLEELLGTKLRVLSQRRKGRDLFDLWLGLEHLAADPDAKLSHEGFRRDLGQLLGEPPAGYTHEAGTAAVRDQRVERLR